MASGSECLIIIGAPRSGTNMLRDVLCRAPGSGTWPCDEINYIWRHGNRNQPTDEFTPQMADGRVAGFIRGAFARIASGRHWRRVVEKTCANSLRFGFVDRIFPEARYVFIHRDGRDAVPSIMKRWQAPLDVPYVLKKARFVPPADVPYYAARYFANRLHRIFSRKKSLSAWGPRFSGMDGMLRSRPLVEVCAEQWARCVESSLDQMASVPAGRVLRVQYERFIRDPVAGVRELADYLGIRLTGTEVEGMARDVRLNHVGKWKKELSAGDLERIRPIIGSAMKRLGYE